MPAEATSSLQESLLQKLQVSPAWSVQAMAALPLLKGCEGDLRLGEPWLVSGAGWASALRCWSRKSSPTRVSARLLSSVCVCVCADLARSFTLVFRVLILVNPQIENVPLAR